ncbi:hypothetical protein E4U92_15675 [Streptomyces galbus]|uniref:Uncharacterized protein n=1 Tax=Streptomyces galbus TaxID=33898 RepID=A0A4V6AYL5_STRGB|nr:hypothetical protein E4U92_15675 [Streptomyces galbus]
MSAPTVPPRAYGGRTTRQEVPMSAQPEEAPDPPAPAAAAQLLAQLREDRGAGTCVPRTTFMSRRPTSPSPPASCPPATEATGSAPWPRTPPPGAAPRTEEST